VKKDQTKHR